MWYTVARVPYSLWSQFNDRDDEQIGLQVLVTIPLLLVALSDLIDSTQLNLFVEDDGFLGAMLEGSACPMYMSSIVGST